MINWRWPSKRGNHYAPWFVIMWRAIWFLPFFLTLTLAWLIGLIMYPRDQSGVDRPWR